MKRVAVPQVPTELAREDSLTRLGAKLGRRRRGGRSEDRQEVHAEREAEGEDQQMRAEEQKLLHAAGSAVTSRHFIQMACEAGPVRSVEQVPPAWKRAFGK